ncbi:phage shock protein A [Pseudoalteromonas undina]|jgi:phage shock protein A|uniref:Phage shock protein A n=1 Tax=Pseudoalteromonas undina TaxID=43660 RepID=A0ABP2XWZ9_9GAMM|nr:PspA/IM30 family protein [Pseudoalteromonas undina]KAF7769323.1 phage shock protein A [Pseudoalteromonas undina]|eukprot:TRINITY_DN550585_c0_g1_i1.p1 TRINITY_DN550585_c0_g1~~TRINITY_DN550585_c0_g1_i1.p1  ORF type:complete len:227 (+),score=18.35 TRINITY_DN550585_c0_g1_i1:32-712(+)
MGIFNRVNDVIQANIVAMLDKAEDSEKLLNLMLTEMQEALNECRSTAAALLCEEKNIKRQISNKQQALTNWQLKAEHAIAKNRDDLAKSALAEKHTVEKNIECLQTQLETLQQSIVKITEDCERLQQKMTQAKAKQAQLVKRENVVEARAKINTQLQSDKVATALSRFEQIERRVESVESQVEAYELTDTASNTATQIESLVKNEKIDAELASLKASLNTANKQTA